MAGTLGYDQVVRLLRSALAQSSGNAWAFQVRSRGRPNLLSGPTWRTLCEIERLLVARVEQALRQDLRVEPRPWQIALSGQLRGLRIALAAERGTVRRLHDEAVRARVSSWRERAPQLEARLWPFFTERTQYLANTLALALNEPAVFPALVWHSGRREFRHATGHRDP